MSTEEKLSQIIAVGKKKDAIDLQIQSLEGIKEQEHTQVIFSHNDRPYGMVENLEPHIVREIKDLTLEVLLKERQKLINEAAELMKSPEKPVFVSTSKKLSKGKVK